MALLGARRLAPLLLVSACYEVPFDTGADAPLNQIFGTVVVDTTEVTGPVVIIAYDATDPPPPTGTGTPVGLATVSPDRFTGDAASIQAAQWALTGLADGTYLIGALYDVDEDFSPLLSILAGGTCGDLAGGHPADLAGTTGSVTVSGGQRIDDVTVAITTEYTVERPAFTLPDAVVAGASNDVFTVESIGIDNDLVTITGPYDPAAPVACDTAFYVYLPDNDGDGFIDPHPDFGGAEGAYDIWPRLYLTYQGDGDTAVGEGERYYTQALIDPTQWVVDGTLAFPPTAPFAFLATSLDAVWPGIALYEDAEGTLTQLGPTEIPTGSWNLTVVSYTGQTWTVPNELALYGSEEDMVSQSALVTVQ